MPILGNTTYTGPNCFTMDTSGGNINQVNICEITATEGGEVTQVSVLMRHNRNNSRDGHKIVICDANGDIIPNGVSNAFYWTSEALDTPHWINLTFPTNPTISGINDYIIYNIASYNATATYYSVEAGEGGRIFNDSGYPGAFDNPTGLNESSVELADRRAAIYLTYSTYSNPSFVSSWDTTKPGDSPAKTIALPLFNGGTYNFTVDYGDESGEKTVTAWNDADATHEYAVDGIYTVTITGQIEGWRFWNSDAETWGDSQRLVEISNWGSLKVGTNQGAYFDNCQNLVVTATDILDISNVTNMYNMFGQCLLFNGSVAGWDTSNVTNMTQTFSACLVFNQPVASWDTSNVMNMHGVFASCFAFNQSLVGWDTSNVTNMQSMFIGCSVFDQSLASLDISNVTDMSYMFHNSNAWSQANYDATLIAWAALTVKPDVVFHVGDATYSPGAATTARGVLTGTYGWTITDGGQN